MSAVILDGKNIAEQIKTELLKKVIKAKEAGVIPGLAAVLVGDDPASKVYINAKTKMCDSLGIYSKIIHLENSVSHKELIHSLDELNHDPQIHGILVQLPLPGHINTLRVLEKIDPSKDVDGFSPVNRGRLQINEETFIPCTPAGIMEIIVRSGYVFSGKHVVILGRSGIVGLPLSLLLVQKKKTANATVTICHSATKDLKKITSSADFLIAAIGKENFVEADMIKDGAIVIDVGINRKVDPDSPRGYKLVGDVDFESVSKKALAITPVPGGVGPMTIIMLMSNTIRAAELQDMR